MNTHRTILTRLLKQRDLSHADIAKAMGWKTASTVGHKLSGLRPWKQGELIRMCELAGVTLVWLADQSSDLHITKNEDTLRGAVLLDEMPAEQRARMIELMASMAGAKKPPENQS